MARGMIPLRRPAGQPACRGIILIHAEEGMYSNLTDFIGAYKHEIQTTQKVLEALTDESLATEKTKGDTSLRELGWHVSTAPAYMINHEGADIQIEHKVPEDATAAQIASEHKRVTDAVLAFCEEKLHEQEMSKHSDWFGWNLPLGVWLNMIINHEVHHRGQISVLMRQAGLTVPNIYGPNKEETAEWLAKQAQEGGQSASA
jgi:uncharacterized damage-inducible protein DinB